MTKSELMVRLAEVFAEKNGNQLLAKDVEYSVKVLVDTMTRSLARGQRRIQKQAGSLQLLQTELLRHLWRQQISQNL